VSEKVTKMDDYRLPPGGIPPCPHSDFIMRAEGEGVYVGRCEGCGEDFLFFTNGERVQLHDIDPPPGSGASGSYP
jgi:hypothetical protein